MGSTGQSSQAYRNRGFRDCKRRVRIRGTRLAVSRPRVLSI